MDNDVYDTPESNLDHKPQVLAKKTKKPWYIFLMALWAFLGIQSYLNILWKSILPDIQNICNLISMLAVIILIINILKMKRTSLIIFGSLCIALVIVQITNVIALLISDAGNPIIYLTLYYIIPSSILAFFSLRPSFLEMAKQYEQYEKEESMRKASFKAMQKR